MSESPTYYANIPATVRLDNDLPPAARLLYGELTALSNMKGYCFATNAYLASLYAVNKRSIQSWIENLRDRGHIKVELIKVGEQVTERRIYILGHGVVQETSQGHEEICTSPHEENTTLNTTRLNTTVNKGKSEKKAFSKPTIEEVQAYAKEKGYRIDAETFWHHHETRGWELSGGKKMKSWRSAVTTWNKYSAKFGDNVEPINARVIL